MTVENTSDRSPLENLLGCLGAGTDAYITGMERAGQEQLVLEDPRPLPEPIPCRGALGLWILPPGVAAAVAAALPEVVR